ncbi:hypothetical protein WR25_26420 isoform C [Diploscapter pachys]|uniref:Uncharacterized protein n=1 Tax=Diploscapter pachys TaxID=2018661 RepID=A0A2A2JM41_9BILA|nr:hypothetical protein WR25_26420 isoform A [Diploscapter pachys]PAV62589.1 hypothetical protein WR25_26420 isoform B [Diploscapter pachys]PAV62590.1 hypothetical protein WR25_26420 isoform C [Diploscapter pachys]
MRDQALTAITAAIYLSHAHRDQNRAKQLLDGVQTIFEIDETHFEEIVSGCISKYQFYSINLMANLSPIHNLLLLIHDDETCRQLAINSAEQYQFELGNHSKFKVKFDVVKLNGERKSAVVRSSSFMKRLLRGDKRQNSIDLSELPLGEKTTFPLKTHGYSIDITMDREIRKTDVPNLEFEDVLEFIQRLHEYECSKWKDESMQAKRKSRLEYDGELSDVPFAILHTGAIFHMIPPIIVEMITLASFLVWDCSTAPLSPISISKTCNNLIRQTPEDHELADMCHYMLEYGAAIRNEFSMPTVFFKQYGIDYIEVSMKIMDEKICSSFPSYLKRQLESLDSRNDEQLDKFTKCTMKIYDIFNQMLKFARDNGLNSLEMENFECWFESIAVFWTYSWRSISKKMVEKTISLADEEDDRKEQQRPLPAGLYSFLCIQKGISDDFAKLALKQSSNLLMTTIAIINIFCENSYAYCKRVYSEALSHRRRRGSQILISPQKYRIARAMNGMEKSLKFTEERWENLLELERVKTSMRAEELEAVKRNAEATLRSTREKCESMMTILAEKVAARRKDEISRIAEMVAHHRSTNRLFGVSWEMHSTKEHGKWDHAITAVENLVGVYHEKMEERCCRLTCAVIGRVLEDEICKRLKPNNTETYYGKIYELLLMFYEQTIEAQVKQTSTEFLRLQCAYSKTENENNIVYLNSTKFLKFDLV